MSAFTNFRLLPAGEAEPPAYFSMCNAGKKDEILCAMHTALDMIQEVLDQLALVSQTHMILMHNV